MAGKIPATVITGFLGAGKTTLVQHMLKNANGKRIALIINEFGDLGIDGDLLKGCGIEGCSDDDVVELSNGCICCTVAEDFIPAIEKLLGRENPPDHIVIETSGLALPQPLVRAFNWPEIRSRVTVDGVVTVVDSEALHAGRFAQNEAAIDAQRSADDMLDHETPLSELFEDQLACADMIILNKADLLSADQLGDLEANLRAGVRDGVQFVRAEMGAVSPQTLLGMGIGAEDDLSARHEVHHHHHDHDDDDHDHHHHEHGHDEFETFQVTLPEISDVEAFTQTVVQTIRDHNILRLKGFAQVGDKPMRLVIQAVGPRIDTYFDRSLTADEKGKTNLVVIGQAGLDRERILVALAG
ncbi:MAG: cobalamin biosynthesis protein CobW [Rhodobacteraceae bacterium]|nr:MAG: cobalamin biosynthesis protein CobW [Paracoccaceae bacterium]